MTSLIEYDLQNTLNRLVILNKYYKEKEKWINSSISEIQLPKEFLTKYRVKEFGETFPNEQQPFFNPTKENINITNNFYDLLNNKNALTVLSYSGFKYNYILKDFTDDETKKESKYLRDFITRLRIHYNKNYEDYFVTNKAKQLLSPNSLREFFSYSTSNGFICADFVSKTLFTITEGPEYYYLENKKAKDKSQEPIKNIFKWNFKFYRFSEKNIKTLILQDLFSQLDNTIPQNELLFSILSLWKYQLLQHKSKIKNQNQILRDINKSSKDHVFINFLQHLYHLLLTNNNSTSEDTKNILTYRNICEFYLEVQNGILTKKSQNILDYFNFNLVKNYNKDAKNMDNQTLQAIKNNIKMLSYHPKFTELNSHFEISNSLNNPQLSKIISELNSDHNFSTKYIITKNIYEIKYEKDTRNESKYPDVFWGVHGTSNNSIPSILLNGLKNSAELEKLMKEENKLNKNNKDYIQYSISGQALGQGVYFAQLNQPTKSIFFTNASEYKQNTGFFIIANIRYNKNNVYRAKNFSDIYDESEELPTLITGEHIGVRELNEYVAPISENIQIKYLIEVKKI